MLGVRVTGQSTINQQALGKTQAQQEDVNEALSKERTILDNSPIDPKEPALQAKFQPGKFLPELIANQAPKIREILKIVTQHETFWRNRLRAYQSIQLPYEMRPRQALAQWTTSAWYSSLSYGENDRRWTVLTAFAIYLVRLTGQTRLQIGYPLSNKQTTATSSSLRASMVPMELNVEWDMSFSGVLEQVKGELQQLAEYRVFAQDLASHDPVLREIPELQVTKPWRIGISIVDDATDEQTIGAFLTLQIDARGRFRWLYDRQCLDAKVVDRMSAHLREVVQAAESDHQKPVKQLNLLPKAEKELLLKTWNATKVPYPDKICIHQLFEKRVKRMPDAIALVYEDQELSYAELNVRANRLAHRLIELGVGPDKRVAICVKRSPAMVVGLLAILKAGGAYVPLDPAYPSERLAQILADAVPTILLADMAGRTALGKAISSSIMVLDPNELPESAIINPKVSKLRSDHLAYIIYTSGSTGMPKGVMMEHRAIVNLVESPVACFGAHSSSRILQVASLNFDVSIWEILIALNCGASLYLPPDIVRYDRNELWSYLARHAITHAILPPALLQNGENLPNLGISLTFVLTGEASCATLLQNLTHHGVVFNAYGPTETHAVTVWPTELHRLSSGTVSIGRPIANTRLYLLDAHGQPVPLGAFGELYIGGAGVARGYLNRSELTTERFLPDPFSEQESARMYKTGDLARYLPDGNLEFLGRNDHQIKIRGFRVEPGEIEARLIEHPRVREAAVLALGEGNNKRLVAYVVAEADEQLASTLHTHLAAKLPDFMIPAAFVRLDALPLTSNRKLDRRALPVPSDEAFARQTYEAPQGEIEKLLAAIWAELLNVKQISRYDSFFALGGHSLLAIQMIERLHHHGLTVSIRALFDVPNLSILAQSIGQHRTVAAPPNLITVDTTTLTPAMLPLIDLSQADIDRIVEQMPGGVANIQDIYALSPLQDGILFHHLLATKGDPYLLIAQMSFANRALLDRYLDALQQVVNRYDILRTAFIWEGLSMPAQVVWRRAPLLIEELSLDSATGPISEQLLHRFNPRQHRIDLIQAPLLRLAIAQDDNGRWLLVKLIHHLIGDHVTVELMDSEVQAFMKGQSNTLLPPQPFRNLVAQARLGVSQEAYERFFREMLAEVDEPTLPFGLAEVHRDGAQVTESHRMLPQDLNDRLRAQARRLGVSLASLCHLAWAQVLARTSGQQRVVFGTVLLGRMQGGEGVDRAMGLFINTLPLCVNLNDMGVEDSVRNTHTQLASLLEYEHASLALVQRCSNVPAGTPLFSALLNYRHNTALLNDGLTEPGIEFLGAQERTNYPFTLSVEDDGHTLGLTAQVVEPYDPVRICGYMQQTLQSLVEALERTPDMPIYQLEVLPRTERELLLNTWNATKQDYPTHQCVHQLFEAQVERAPEAVALVYEDQVFSYAELNVRANRLAHRLIELGVGPDKRVAICVERSPAMMVGLLAILKAGGVYVPLDPAYSSERLSYILTDAAPTMLLADAAGRTALGEATLSSITALDPNELPALAITNPHIPGLSSNRLAYVIYTSGSTGTPKGVMVEHRSIVNLARAQQVYFEIGPSSRVLQFISFSFDASTGEIFTALGSGASLYLPLDGVRRDRNGLWDYFAKHAITHAAFPPALLQGNEDFPNLKTPLTLILGGEKPSAALLRALSSQGVIFNAYGPTEATVCTTAWRCPSDLNKEVVVPIGRPLANTQLYVLDANGLLAPMGAVGELYIGGAGVARGYLNRPELTTERFLPDPFREDEDARMYKTGDLVRYLPDGNLEFLGRNDHQIKIRGFRIEPSEIEACLIEHPQVREAVVLALGEGSDKRLIAYVVAEADEQLASTLRANLATRLPEYMLPSAFVRLDALPLTPNGKLDRRALPAPSDEAVARQAYEAPQGKIETTLANIWAELLKVERISRYDSFFALGGHSLLAVQMIERLRGLGLTVSVRVLFDKPTLKALAQSLGQHQEVVVPPNLITVDTTTLTPAMLPLIDLSQADIDRIVEQMPGGVANIQDIYALSPLQDGILFHHLLATKGDPYLLIAQMSFANRALLDRYLDALQQVANRHDILRTAFIWEGLSTPAQVVWRHAPLSIEELSLDPAAGPLNEQLLHRFDPSQHRIDLTQAPLLHFAIAQDGNGHWQMVELLHHLIGDHSTLEVLQSEIQAFLDGQGDMLAPPQPFRNLIAQARLGVSQEAYERFFREMLAEVDEPTLPFGLAEVHQDDAQVTESHRMLPQDLNDRLRAQARRLGVSLASLCHLAWAQVLARTSGQQRVVFGTVLLGRMQGGEGADRAMGLFINTLPLCVNLNDMGVEDSVRNTHARLASLLEYEHASLALAQRCSNVPAGTPLFSALLNYRHNTAPLNDGLTEPGIEFLGAHERTNYPFTLSVEDGGHTLGLTAQVVEPYDPVRICGYMQQTLQSLVRALERTPDMPVYQLEALPRTERELLLNTWNATTQDYPSHLGVHQLFEAQVERAPEAIAFVYEDQVLSYAELNAQANRLAHRLIELGVGPDKRVAICVERSPAMMVGLLAILKAGGAYVPLDPAYPSERLTHILIDATPMILLADVIGRTVLGEAACASLTVLDPNQLPESIITNPKIAEFHSDHIAYVIYTSGSTGTPKGVMVAHQSVVNLTQAQQAYLVPHSSSRVLQFTSISFDVSVPEIMALSHGASLYLPSDNIRRDRDSLWNYVEKYAITHAILPPALLQDGKGLPSLNRPLTLILTGEAPSALLLHNLAQQITVFNAYGPTEITVWASMWHRPHDFSSKAAPIGRPIANTRFYLLDVHGQPVPVGAVGELYIGGAGVARGYLNRPELTAERFLPDPFNEDKGARMYKTGDLARYLPDGNLEFLGRNDHQIKIRGFRIEPGEVESGLIEHPLVREAVVLALGEGSDKRLVAYVVAGADEQLVSTLRVHLATKLPDYMVPAAFVRLDALPLTPNGKLDRRALPAPSDEAVARQVYEAPQGKIETMLAAIWSELLKVEQISRHDSFFALGGHSLLAVRLMNRITLLGVELPLAALFALPTLSAFAAAVNERLTQANTISPTIASVSRDGVLPLSFAQQRLWFLAQLEGINETYHIPLAIRLLGVLDRGAWQRALDTVFTRHEALRSVFMTVDGQPQIQLLPPESGLPMRYHDLRQYPNATEQVEHLSIEEARAPFDLAQGPLIRAGLIQLTDEEHVFLLTQHHIVSDGWSLNVLQRELEALYTAYRAGSASPLPPMGIQYPDYTAWQRQWLSEDRLKTQSEYWRTTLADAPILLNLPTDRPRPAQQSFSGDHVPVQLDAQMTSALKRLSQKHGVTLFMSLLAGWGAVLSRLSGQEDIVIGTPSANRNHPEIEPLIGFFVNTLALRLDLSGEPNTIELFERLRRGTLAAQAHQDLPFEQVVEIVQPPRRLDHTPLFQVMFAWQNNEGSKWHLPALEVTPVDSNYDAVKFDLELDLQEVGDEIIGELGYAKALFDRQTIERQVGYLYAILRAMVSDAQQSLAQVDILAPAERKLLLETWNATQREYSTHQCVHQLFEAQVERTPEATAIVYENQELSYAELNARANRLAHRLIELGVGPDRRVAICMERSPAWIVGLLAILKAGGAYVPLDPAYPSERLTQILADAAPTILLTDATGRSVLGEAVLALRTVLDPNSPPALADTNPSVSSLTPHHLAYVVYTSGSTGTPKGVMVEHRGVVNLAHVQMTSFGVDASSRILQFVSPGFDASTWEIIMALGCGASLYLPPAAARLDRHRLWDYLERHAITHATIPPALLQDGRDLPNLSTPVTLFLIGEALNATLLRAVRHHGLVFNGYGPTEATIGATVWPSPPDFNSEIVPIGRPMANIRLYLLDAHHQPVPVGAAGELYIGGVAVARGYLNRPELTAERFLQDPFSAEEDARMYKTGDLARYLPDGNLEFIGRNDYQIKMRGLRIEPGEIEARLVEHSKVREAAVLAVGEGSHKRLVAYVVAETDEQLAATLHTHLVDKLPEYMVPAAFVRLDALPLTSNGKLDRRALPTPDGEAFARQAYEAPQGEIETALANIWSKLLKIERISRHDSFFALGGHSLLAVQMIESLRRLGLTVSVRALFDKPILKALAQSLDQHQEVIIPPNLITTNTIALTPAMLPLIDFSQAEIDQIIEQTPGGVANIQDIYALSPLQDGILFHHLLATKGDPYLLIAQMIFANRESLNRYLHAVQQVINRHDILRTAFVWDKLSAPAQVVWRHAPLSITELSLDTADGLIAEQLSQRFDPRHHRLDLTQAPLLQFVIAQDDDGRWQLTQLLHHLIGDHSTLEEMQREIQAFLEGQGDTLLAPQTFRNLVAQARLGVSQEAHERFFKEMLAEVDEPTLPFGLSEVYRDGTQVTESYRTLAQDLNDRLRAQAKRLNVSLASLCHLAWAQVLARTTGQQRVVFGTVLFGRMQAGEGADRALGLFINTLPLRIDVGHRSVQESVRDTQTRLATLLEHEHASLALAQRCSRVPAGTPLFSSLLNYRHHGMQDERQISSKAELLRSEERDNYPIGLSVEDYGQALGLTAYIAQPFDAERVCGYMHQALQSLAEALEHTPDKPVYQLEVLPPSEQELLLDTWNATAIPYPEHQCLHWLFEAQVERIPQAIALVRDNQTVSYAELNAQANRLAHYLRDLGVQPDSRVALLAQSSIEAVIAMLAVIKAGGAYVPLDPDYPPERLVDMVTDCAPVALLSIGVPHAAVVQCLGAEVPVLDLQADATQWERYSSLNPDPYKFGLNAEHLAYVIYTSGSTGRPKGVMVEHRNVVNDVTAAAKLLDFSSQDRMLQFASLSFDVSVEEIFLTLTRGATLVLRTDAWVAGATQFWALCEANQISVVDLPTPFWAQLVQEQVAIPGCVRTIYAGGDAFSAAAAHQAWFTGTGHRPRLLNGYGLTETSITNTAHDVTADDSHWRTIGRPLANTRLYILDSLMQPVPLGMVGELHIGGAGVARGYLHRPELTKERFLLDPFSDQVNARMYKTGDLVRYLPNGNLEFLGRNDHQVKIRGFRIELSEIEARLTEHSQVSEAVVLALGEGSDKRLVAYVVAEADEPLAITLRAHLAAKLPEYMMPSAFIRLDALPLTPNGKLDRRALPVLSDEDFARQIYEAPQGEIEIALAKIWSELLGLTPVSRHDNFFALGGHSLLAVRMMSRVNSILGIEITLRTLFEAPTVADLAQRLMQPNSAQEDSFDVLLPIQPSGTRPPLFCIHPVLGISWSYIGLSQHLGKDQPIYGLQARGMNGSAPLPPSIDAMAADYIEQIRRVQPDGPYYLLGWSLGGNIAYSMATQLEQQGEKVALLALMDSYSDLSPLRDVVDQDDDFIAILNRYSVEGMADAGKYLWEKTGDVIRNNERISEDFAPLIYRGDILFFRATVVEDRFASSPDLWKSYVLGDIETHDIHCEHKYMDQSEPMAKIGRVLANRLEKLQKG
ncbi:non-ribosomal peptide synthetase [Mycoavidus sp. SF9855]|uniref:non-ribosomal peptide synthetase n=1 Tax=Mycoavidus sp. SF9855 TaxID=2968475 RepID=UPI00211CD5F6|nr:non-ribosomal peptide synthetase [Mycoavidus sp. SF9855]UUM20748.1 amino acid adenylation domain-containing protein [Mycoavidus sp. SF9855]